MIFFNINIILFFLVSILAAQEDVLIKIIISEQYGYERELEYIELECPISFSFNKENQSLYLHDINNDKKIPCQILGSTNLIANFQSVRIIFPVSCKAFEEKEYILKISDTSYVVSNDITFTGEGTELVVDSKYYRADLRKNEKTEGHSFESGQIREILIKMNFNQLLTNKEDRVHWGPNFKRPEIEYYKTIAHWEKPDINLIDAGNYLIRTLRRDYAPEHHEILLSARYDFYSNLPYFKFYSKMEFKKNLLLELLRNDEMTTDSMFTNLAYKKPNGDIIDLEFSKRYEILEKSPIENNAPWVCFYNSEKGFAFGSIRIKYDNRNNFGMESPLYQPHTQIGEWLEGIKYWNRRLIHDHLTFVPQGSSYTEENAYLVFSVKNRYKFQEIMYWADRLRHPLQVKTVIINN